MRWIKKFEAFDFRQTLPTTSKSYLTQYYSCDECDALWKSFNQNFENCKFCKSTSIEELNRDEWYESACDRLDDEEIDDLLKEKEDEEVDFVNLSSLKKSKIYVN
jgi:hypothetical protein